MSRPAEEATPYVSTAEAAVALGVGVSTVKRWVDDGVLPAHRTAGGHRKLLRAEVLALARSGEVPREDAAGLVVSVGRRGQIDPNAVRKAFLAALLRGDAADSRDIVRRAYRSGFSIEALADLVVAPAMTAIGHEWEADRIDVWREHRGTQICLAAFYDLQAELQFRAERGRPVAVGGAPEGDPYQLATLLAQLVLLDSGWNAVNLGPNTPVASFAEALGELRPKLIWIAASHLPDEERFLREHNSFCQTAERAGIAVAVGGPALTAPLRQRMRYTTHGDGLTHLASFARTLHPRPRRPRRGRPPKRLG